MANLTRLFRWERFAPNIGDNLELPEEERLHLEVASGLTREQMLNLSAAVKAVDWTDRATVARQYAELYAPYVRLVGKHTVDGAPLETLEQLFALALTQADAGLYVLREVMVTLMEFNSLEGSLKLFSARRSGGGPGTASRSAAKGSEQTEGR